jgi:hypothetical protein
MKENRIFHCASCGADITESCKKTNNPLKYERGPRKGQEKKCCANPDWRNCPDKHCSSLEDDDVQARTCKNCGCYSGAITWWKVIYLRDKTMKQKEKDELMLEISELRGFVTNAKMQCSEAEGCCYKLLAKFDKM